MKYNEYDELPDKTLLEQLVVNEQDPASIHYKRVLNYPKMRYKVILFNVLGFLIVITLIVIAMWYLTNNVLVTVLVPISVGLIYLFIRLSSILIFFVECYQLLAPEKTRMKCRFEPSCSQYMILAIRKYGAIKGLIKGLKRLKRCGYPNGGYDMP